MRKEIEMTLAEKLRFLADRVEDKKEFYIMYGENKILTDYEEFTESYDIQELEGITLSFKPQWEFTEDEKVILRNLPEQYKWIARDDDGWTMGELFIYAFKPMKFNGTWIFDKGSVTDLDSFKHLFQSIQWEDEEPCEFRKYL